ncbi:MAG TPA: Z1 domain-containing protein [Candidatus Aminicenantes bacterium]|nr:Z1 domain-containing protein [Candidatus Aminicenantes bacterium]HRY65571.1 Z1 domain-containing protein [Candidatus Aminicenantes bacterium]HRZ72541.1 Z1 domain-containing protein [Candidatus Aminicenantes bacterium]
METNAALAICQILLGQKRANKDAAICREDILAVVEQFAALEPAKGIDKEELVKTLEERFTVYVPNHLTLGSDDNHIAWLSAKRSSINWQYWERYKNYLEGLLPPAAVEGVGKTTEEILQRLEDPYRTGIWDRRGLVMGNVQSGKTANYCGLICKAADAGYKVIIVLSGIHNSLRSQTQIRLDEGFLGFMSEPLADGTRGFVPAGVGINGPSINPNTATNRTERGDFNRTIASQFGIHPGGLPLLFVTKKNVSVLRNLNNWISSCMNAKDPSTTRRFVRDVPLLVIDDEADLASVDTHFQELDENGNPDPDHNPAETNKQIRKLLRAFEKVAYVAYTATPYANIYIYDRGFTPLLGDDLFPRSFVVSIPPPSNYMGPARVFGISEDEDAGLEEVTPLPVIRNVKDHAVSADMNETRGWMPPRLIAGTDHMPRYLGERRIPPTLREAILSFILASIVRKSRGCLPAHNSMLIHVVRYTKVQKLVSDQVEETLREITQRLRYGDGSRRPTITDEFRNLYLKDFKKTTESCNKILNDRLELPVWTAITPALLSTATSIKVKIINGSAGDVLDYEENKKTGMNVIAIGGDKLSRGLTLEGLSISYFLRASRMYDTLMQMGRWFGYRGQYIDICRLYTTSELIKWFAHITAAAEELRHEFERMVSVGGTPKDYGLKIRAHPALLVTSAVKMRHGTSMRISFSGEISETIIFQREPWWVLSNYDATVGLLSSLPMEKYLGFRNSGYTWQEIPIETVLQYLNEYKTHNDVRRADTALLAKYIRAQNENGELAKWTIHLCSSGKADAIREAIGNQKVGLIMRAPFPQPYDPQADRYTIRRLVSPTDELVDLSKEQQQEAIRLTQERWKAEHRMGEPERAGGREIRKVRDKNNGLLLLYPIGPPSFYPAGTKPIIGMAISFPKSDTAKEVIYTVNNVFTQQGGDDESF